MSKRRSATPGDDAPSPPSHPQRAWALLERTLRGFLGPGQKTTSTAREFQSLIPAAQRAYVEAILESYRPGGAGKSYRIGLIVQLAFGLTSDARTQMDLTQRPPG